MCLCAPFPARAAATWSCSRRDAVRRRACRRRGGEVAVHFKKLSKRQVRDSGRDSPRFARGARTLPKRLFSSPATGRRLPCAGGRGPLAAAAAGEGARQDVGGRRERPLTPRRGRVSLPLQPRVPRHHSEGAASSERSDPADAIRAPRHKGEDIFVFPFLLWGFLPLLVFVSAFALLSQSNHFENLL